MEKHIIGENGIGYTLRDWQVWMDAVGVFENLPQRRIYQDAYGCTLMKLVCASKNGVYFEI